MNIEINNPADLHICKSVILDELNFLKLLSYTTTNEIDLNKINSEIKSLRKSIFELQQIKIEMQIVLQNNFCLLN